MRKLFATAFVSLFCVAPAMAQQEGAAVSVASGQTSPLAEPDQTQKEAQSLEEALRTQLAHAGFTDIQMMPTSFLIQAKDADGNPVTLVFSPKQDLEDNPADAPRAGKVDGEEDF